MSQGNLVGQILGQYQLRELLGIGGMGAVYRAYQTPLKREVAVKIISPDLVANNEAMMRFIREAEVSARLEHNHIIPIYDFGTANGITYVVMRLLTGGSLARRIEQRVEDARPLISLGEASDLLKQLASALDYAHSHSVIHRDIKPANIMFDNQAKAYVVDFGIAKLTKGATAFTQTGTAMGTPNYMPPEQWRGEDLTPQADQYALGVMIYQLLTGRVPFDGDSAFVLMHKHLNEQPTPLNMLRPDIPPAVMMVINRTLAKNYRQRFQSCTAFALAFESAIENHQGQPSGMFVFPIRPASAIFNKRPFTPNDIPFSTQPKLNPKNIWIGGLLAGLITIIVLLGFLLASNNTNNGNAPDDTHPRTSGVVILSNPTDTPEPSLTWTATMDEPSPTSTETVTLDSRSSAQTLVVEQNNFINTAESITAIINAELTLIRLEMQFADETPTATPTITPSATATQTPSATTTYTLTITPSSTITPTATNTPTYNPTPDLILALSQTQTIEFDLTQTAQPTNTLTETPNYDATLNLWASQTAFARPTQTATLTPSHTPSNTPTLTFTPEITPSESLEQFAFTPVTSNEDWTPIERDFNGVTMVLVPVGCFMMGNNIGAEAEQPAHEQCFNLPFWIDKYEVNIGQFDMFNGSAINGVNSLTTPTTLHPRVGVSWFEAVNFCLSRGGKLPTEREWEYAARGPSNFLYPWGGDWIVDNLVWVGNSGGNPQVVGSFPNGASWVGALDLAGNVREWVSSIYAHYPYNYDDGRERDTGSNGDVLRV